ncbi:MAG TPA: response regulator [Burkholderiales bacterium]|nr:response regulator [Burkholderiales bacterium]
MSPQILLVDDDRSALYALNEVLGDLPVRLVFATSGEEALRQVLKTEFAAILLDVRLPNMDGFEVAAAIRSLERTRRTPIIFMSANEDRRKTPRPTSHPERYFRKPLIPELVCATVLSFLPAPALEASHSELHNRV